MVERISGISLANGFVITICTLPSREKVRVESSLLTVRGRESQASVASSGAPKMRVQAKLPLLFWLSVPSSMRMGKVGSLRARNSAERETSNGPSAEYSNQIRANQV